MTFASGTRGCTKGVSRETPFFYSLKVVKIDYKTSNFGRMDPMILGDCLG